MPQLVKGAGFRGAGTAALQDEGVILEKAYQAEKALREATKAGYSNPSGVVKGLNPDFMSQFGGFISGLGLANGGSGMAAMMDSLAQQVSEAIGKNITLTSPLSSGLVPFDLLAPARLIYPVYTPLRNKFPRVNGQGTSRRAKVFTGITGSQTPSGSGAPARITIAEASLGSWPTTLPSSGTQTAQDINIPYKFMGLTEGISWLAQFAGQGFEDISALANMILMQEMMLGEEYELMAATGTAVTVPSVSVALRTAGSNETAVAAAGSGNSYYVRITGVTPFGETTMSTAAEAAVDTATTKVIDLTITPTRGVWQYNAYISAAATSSSAPSTRTSYFKYNASPFGGTLFTIQGTLPTSGTNPPASDSGTSGANDFEGLASILSGHAVTDASVYPAGFLGGYVKQNAAATLSDSVVQTALQALWDASGAYRASPSELICEGGDAKRFADSLALSSTSPTGYRIYLTPADQAGVRSGAAVSEIVNSITRDIVRIMVHPFWSQGTAMLMSYQLPTPWSNISNIFEMTMVQDYLSVAWPVIDPTFRYSIFAYGALVCYAAQFCGLIQGLQVSSATPYS